jgi:hypothetical protein
MPEGQHDIAAVARRPDARQSTTVTRRPAHSASMAVALPTAPAPITTAWRRAPPMTPLEPAEKLLATVMPRIAEGAVP